jgi:hypothetical protein
MPDSPDHLIRMLERYPTVPTRFTDEERRAYLVARGERLAHDLDLGQVEAHDLQELGRLDVLGMHPALPERVAVALEMAQSARSASHNDPYVPLTSPRPGGGPGEGNGEGPGQSPAPTPAPEALAKSNAQPSEHGAGNGKPPGDGSLGPYAVPETADRNAENDRKR